MPEKIAFLHTVPTLIDLFKKLTKKYFPEDLEIYNLVDEILLKTMLAQGGLSPFIFRRVAEHAAAAEFAGASLLQVTCSSLSPCIENARTQVSIPVLKIDQPMVERAVALGSTIGVIATASTTLRPTSELVVSTAASQAKAVKVESILCQDAYKALFSGDLAKHDQILSGVILDLASRTDVVVLAQASMARVLEMIDPMKLAAPVLSSPELAVERAAQVYKAGIGSAN